VPAKFVVKKASTGKYRFTLNSARGQNIATSAVYDSRAAALAAIRTVRRLAAEATVEDLTTKKPALAAGRKRATGATGAKATSATRATRATGARPAAGNGTTGSPFDELPVDDPMDGLGDGLADGLVGDGLADGLVGDGLGDGIDLTDDLLDGSMDYQLEDPLDDLTMPILEWIEDDIAGYDDDELEAQSTERRSGVRFRYPIPPGHRTGHDALHGLAGWTNMPGPAG
jgi:uncharacterized protein YegP (UPF0339 family)